MVEASRNIIKRIYSSLNAENGKTARVERRKGTERPNKPGASLRKSPLHTSTYIEEEYDLPSTQIARAPYSDPNIQFSLGLCE